LARKDGHWLDNDGPLFNNQLTHSLGMLEEMQQKLPDYQSKIICDVPLDFRANDKEWDNAEQKGLTILRYWNYYRAASVYKTGMKPVTSYRYANESLSLLPPLKKGELPHKPEVLGRLFRYFALVAMAEDELAYSECRAILAAIRLLHHEGRLDMYDSNDILMRKTDVLPNQLIRLSVKLKMKEEGASRPYFTRDDRLDLMKELGIGLYSDTRYKCSTCGKTKSTTKGDDGVKQLSLCSRCSDVWYCGAECAKKGWSEGGHKHSCGSLSVEQPLQVTDMAMTVIFSDMCTGVSIVDNKSCDQLLVLAREKSFFKKVGSKMTEGVYDVLTDKEVEMEVNEKGADTDGSLMEDMMATFGGFGGGLLGGVLGQGSSNLSIDEKMTQQMKQSDIKSGKCAKELHDIREKAGDWLSGLSRVPYGKKW